MRRVTSRRPCARSWTSAGHVTAVVIELTDITRLERDRLAHARTRQRLDKAAVLNDRLLRANDELSSLIADLRLANKTLLRSSEDAQAGREEVETLNEEFQATNEELETLNEELTATVEELRIANEDLAARTEELRLQTAAMEVQKRETEEEHDRLALDPGQHRRRGRRGRSRWAGSSPRNIVYERLFGGPAADIPSEDVAGLPFAARRPAPAASGPGRAFPGGVRGQRSGRQAPLVRGRRGAADGDRTGPGAGSSPSGTSPNGPCASASSG